MKALKAICAATVLALSLSIATYGESTDPGIVQLPGVTSHATGNHTAQSSGDAGSPAVTSTELGDVGSSAFMDTLLLMISIF
jgi:hypothetical protein